MAAVIGGTSNSASAAAASSAAPEQSVGKGMAQTNDAAIVEAADGGSPDANLASHQGEGIHDCDVKSCTPGAGGVRNPPENPKYTLLQAVGFNTMNMFGTGPLITMPYCLNAVDPAGPQAIIGYAIACVACTCDSLVWGEIGSMWPESGGSYVYLRELYGKHTWGRLASFIYIWQFLVSGPAEVASGFIGIAEYMVYYDPEVLNYWPRVGISLAALLVCSCLLFRNITDIGRVTVILWGITLITIGYTLIAGFTDWDASRLEGPEDGFKYKNGRAVITALSAATRFGVYDMTGYYDVCFMGGEVRNPRRTIPVSCITTCVVVAVIYILVYVAVLGHLPWQSFVDMYSDDFDGNPVGIMSLFTESRFNSQGLAYVVTGFVGVTIFGSVFSMLCGFGYLPYAAARDGVFFSIFAHESKRCPGLADYSLLVVVILSAAWCFFDLELVIEAMTTMLVLVQFIGQSVGLMYYRFRTPKDKQANGWRMPLFPLPCIIQTLIFTFIWITTDSVWIWGDDDPILELSVAFLLAGCVLFFIRQKCFNGWPFGTDEPECPDADSIATSCSCRELVTKATKSFYSSS